MLKYVNLRVNALLPTSIVLMAGALSVSAKTSFQHDDEAGTLDIIRDGKPLLRYMHARDTSTPQRAHETYKVYCHVFDPVGEDVITKGPGGKFTHHRGIFIGWNKLRAAGKSYDLWHMGTQNVQLHKEFLTQKVEDGKATLSVRIHWLNGEGDVLISEKRTFVVHIDADAHLLLDFTSELTAGDADVELGGDPEHAGMQYRPHNDVAENKSATYIFPKEDNDPRKDLDLPWATLTYKLGNATYSVQHITHPDNPKGTKYSAYRDYGRFGAFPTLTIKAGETATLQYGLRVTTGDVPSRETMNQVFDKYVKRTSNSKVSDAKTGAKRFKPPNILFMIADDWGWPHAGAYGDEVVKTPTFNRLAREGVLFEHAFVSSPSCTPSRNAILTGQYHWRLKDGANLHSTLDVKTPVYPKLLEEAGYHIGRWRKSWGPGKLGPGGWKKDEHPAGPEYNGFQAFMEARPKDKPFCFWLGSSDPHRSYKRHSGLKSGMDIDAISVPQFWPNVETVRSDIADYYFEVQRFDSDCGEAIALLEEIGELDNTIIVMTGDHGMPFPRCKSNIYDMGVRVPLVIRWGTNLITPSWRSVDFVSLTDLAPTFLETAGVGVPEPMTGKSLVPLLKAAKVTTSCWIDPGNDPVRFEKQRDHVIFGMERHTPAQKYPSMDGYPCRGIRTGRYLFIWNIDPQRWPAGVPDDSTRGRPYADCDDGPTKAYILEHRDDPQFAKYYELCFARRPGEELYDLQADPDQLNNLAEDPAYAQIKQRLATQLKQELKASGDPRVTGGGEKFDTYPYHGAVKKR